MKTTDNIINIPFVKMSAAGNDFVLLDETQLSLQIKYYELLARKLCNRNYGVGADGLLVYKRHHTEKFEMGYYNADGSTGGMCGNGARCISAYHFDVHGKERQFVTFTAFGHFYKAKRDGIKISVQMKDPSHLITDLTINVEGIELDCNFIDTGSPHVVIFFNDLQSTYPDFKFENFNINHLGNRIRHHEAFRPLGTNANFVMPVSAGTIRVRTYERGVEGETLGCGTGAIASAVIFSAKSKNVPPIAVQTKSGEILEVNFSLCEKFKNFSDITLSGTWRYHFWGIAYIDVEDEKNNGIESIPDSTIQSMRSLTINPDR